MATAEHGVKFYDDITGQGVRSQGRWTGRLTALNQVTEVLGPGRLSRATELQLGVEAGVGAVSGVIEWQGSSHQDFPGTPYPLGTTVITAPGFYPFNMTGSHLFIRGKVTTAIPGEGAKVYAQGM